MKNIITKVEAQVKNKDRYNVYVNDKYLFSISSNTYIDNPYLKKGYEISDEEIEELKKMSGRELAFFYILYQNSFGKRTEKQMRDKFKKQGKYSPSEIEYAIDKAKNLLIIDDDGFCRSYIESCKNKNYGKRKIISKLIEKGIYKDIYEPIFEELENGDEDDFLESAIERCRKKNNSIKIEDMYKRKGALYRHLAYHGFNSDIINKAIEIVLEEDS